MLPPGYSRVPSKNVNPFGPAVWPAIANIQSNIYDRRALLYRLMYVSVVYNTYQPRSIEYKGEEIDPAIACQTAGPNGLTFFEGTLEYPGGNIS